MNKYLAVFLVTFFSASFFTFGWYSHSSYTPGKKIKKITLFDNIKRSKELSVVLLNSPSTYYIGIDSPTGFEYDLLKNYADDLGVALKIKSVHTVEEALSYSTDPRVHIISAGIAKKTLSKSKYNFGPSYFEVQEQVVCSRSLQKKSKFPRDVEDLAGLTIVVAKDSSYAYTLEALKNDGFDINASYVSGISTQEILEQVSSGEIDCTIANSNVYSLNLRYYTEIAMAFSITGREELAWILPENSSELEIDLYAWLNSFNQQGKMRQLKDHYYSYILYFDYYSTRMYHKRMLTRLPKYTKMFKDAGEYYGIPWTLLASISYQESHWNAQAKSYTGVRGLMMLTLHTAKLLHVKNRLDPKQSIVGGTRHIKQMLKFVKPEVKGENRLKFALAAYNIGWGHIRDAQGLAVEKGLDKNEWSDLKKVLPLLSQKRYYVKLQYGFARGEEPVKYVESIYNYRHILENKIKNEELKTLQQSLL